MIFRILLFGALLFLIAPSTKGQTNDLKAYGEIRFAYFGNTDESTGIGNGANTSGSDFFGVRIRYGYKYQINSNSLFAARLVGQFRDDTDELRFTIKADGPGIAPGAISFDEFYYQYQNETTTVKIGRFQQNLNVISNSGRNSIRFQSNVIFVHWTDGLYLKHALSKEWNGEIIAEYQPRNAITFPYKRGLDFGNSANNVTVFAGVDNKTRDQFNFIQKGIGLFVAPNAYQKNGDYTHYSALISRIVYDLPQNDLLDGGSFRIAGELSQNINTQLSKGTNGIISAGINRFAGKHDLMLEFSRTDPEWLLATTYAPGNDEMELRYRVFPTNKVWMDIRYRVRVNDNPALPYAYSTFIRFNYSI